MLEINAKFKDSETDLGMIGRVDEGSTRKIIFNCHDILTEYPNANIIAVVTQPHTGMIYSTTLTTSGENRIMMIERTDTKYPGTILIELRAIIDANGNKRKSAFYRGKIEGSMVGEGDNPGAPIRDVLDRAEGALENAEERLERLEDISAVAVTLPAGSQATASFNNENDVLTIGVPKGDTGSPAVITRTAIETALYAEPGDNLFSGSYDDLSDKPSIPSKTSEIQNDSGYITKSVTNLDNYYAKSSVYTKSDIGALYRTKEDQDDIDDAKYNKPVNGIPKSDLDASVKASIDKADSAIQSVKTINGADIKGTGNINVGGGGNIEQDPTDEYGGVVAQGTMAEIDATLTQPGKAADAKVCGDKFDELINDTVTMYAALVSKQVISISDVPVKYRDLVQAEI